MYCRETHPIIIEFGFNLNLNLN